VDVTIKSAVIYDATGKQYAAEINGQSAIDVSNLPFGVYFVEILDHDGNKMVSKFVKD